MECDVLRRSTVLWVSLAAFIATQRVEHGVPQAVACRALDVSQAWFYKWAHGDVSLRRRRRAALTRPLLTA